MTALLFWIGKRALGLHAFIGRQFRWLFADQMRVIVASLLLLWIGSLVLGLQILGQRNVARAALASEEAAHQATIDAVASAAKESDRRNEWRLRTVAREQAAITERTTHDYETRLAAVRTRAEQLRITLSKASRRYANGAAMPATSGATSQADEAAGDHGLSATCQLTLDERLVATEQAVQLDELINWVEDQSRVEVNP